MGTAEEAVEAMKKASEAGYRPPQRRVPRSIVARLGYVEKIPY
ncbi:MAG TPA: hypothetical protein VE572_06325 [Nitrososphaeraceae archaeon]|nr:hypothetical protein [Nitrososphaeraceae archaeon]